MIRPIERSQSFKKKRTLSTRKKVTVNQKKSTIEEGDKRNSNKMEVDFDDDYEAQNRALDAMLEKDKKELQQQEMEKRNEKVR